MCIRDRLKNTKELINLKEVKNSKEVKTHILVFLPFVANNETFLEQFEEKINFYISKNIFDTFGTDFLAHISRLGKPGG